MGRDRASVTVAARQLDKVIAAAIGRAWAAGCGPGAAPMTIDLDSTICEVHGKAKHGAAYGYTKVLGYHPLLATRAGTGEVLHARLRKGSSQRGQTLRRRAHRPLPPGWRHRAVTVRADAGFWSYALIDTLNRLGVSWSITVRINPAIRRAIEAGRAPTRLAGKVEQTLWPDWRHHAFITCMDLPTVEMDQFHRDHAAVELAIRDLKEGAGLEHCPSGHFYANAAWLGCAVLAHNLIRWTARLGDVHPATELTVT